MADVLLHIGYPKAGATFLWEYFSNNPHLHADGNIFNDYIQSGKIKTDSSFQLPPDKFNVISEERFSVWGGEIDIVGVRFKPYDIKSHQEETCRSLGYLFPKAKILIVTRGFASAVRSMYWQYVSIGGVLFFQDFQKEYSKYLADFYDYDFIIRTYRSVFKSLVILPFELLQENTGKFLCTMEEECGLPHFNFNNPKANASLFEKIESYRRLSSLIYKTIYPVPYSWKKGIYGLYVYALYNRKLNWFSNLFPAKTELQLEEATLNLFTGKAELLLNEKNYNAYHKEYRLLS